LHGCRSGSDPEKVGRAHQNGSAGCRHAGAASGGELARVWVPDAAHEAVRDLVRAREAATDDLRRKRQQLL